MTKPKGKIPSLVSGKKPKLIDVKRKITCTRCQTDIKAGEKCFGVPNIRIKAFITTYKKYCRVCMEQIITQTERELNDIKELITP